MVGVIKIRSSLSALVFVLLLKSQPKRGMLEIIGTPLVPLVFLILSMPPITVVSPLRTSTVVVALLSITAGILSTAREKSASDSSASIFILIISPLVIWGVTVS